MKTRGVELNHLSLSMTMRGQGGSKGSFVNILTPLNLPQGIKINLTMVIIPLLFSSHFYAWFRIFIFVEQNLRNVFTWLDRLLRSFKKKLFVLSSSISFQCTLYFILCLYFPSSGHPGLVSLLIHGCLHIYFQNPDDATHKHHQRYCYQISWRGW